MTRPLTTVILALAIYALAFALGRRSQRLAIDAALERAEEHGRMLGLCMSQRARRDDLKTAEDLGYTRGYRDGAAAATEAAEQANRLRREAESRCRN